MSFRTEIRGVEVDVTVDFRRLARYLTHRAVRNDNGQTTALDRGVVVQVVGKGNWKK